jgi:23S rRNA pseudouridine955/2504/2580 synthase
MKEIIITDNDAGQRLDKFLTKAFPSLPLGMLYKAIRKKDIKINGKRAFEDSQLQIHDTIKIFIKDEFLVKKRQVNYERSDIDIIFEDNEKIIVNKPCGLVVHEDDAGSTDTLIGRILGYLIKKGEYDPENEQSFVPALCNRIDRNTSGIVIAAKTAAALRGINEKIRSREIKKFYLCVTVGVPPEGEFCAYHIKGDALVKIFDSEIKGSKRIVTRFKVIKTYNTEPPTALVEAELITGRTHQIRAHLAHIGYPLLGDGKYGKNSFNKQFHVKTQLLHSQKIVLDGETYITDMPWFDEYLEKFTDLNAEGVYGSAKRTTKY